MGCSPGLVVKGGDSCHEGRGFESHHHMEGHFYPTKSWVIEAL